MITPERLPLTVVQITGTFGGTRLVELDEMLDVELELEPLVGATPPVPSERPLLLAEEVSETEEVLVPAVAEVAGCLAW